jgi:hypothetical protein
MLALGGRNVFLAKPFPNAPGKAIGGAPNFPLPIGQQLFDDPKSSGIPAAAARGGGGGKKSPIR